LSAAAVTAGPAPCPLPTATMRNVRCWTIAGNEPSRAPRVKTPAPKRDGGQRRDRTKSKQPAHRGNLSLCLPAFSREQSSRALGTSKDVSLASNAAVLSSSPRRGYRQFVEKQRFLLKNGIT
jgi:hypothetical protein